MPPPPPLTISRCADIPPDEPPVTHGTDIVFDPTTLLATFHYLVGATVSKTYTIDYLNDPSCADHPRMRLQVIDAVITARLQDPEVPPVPWLPAGSVVMAVYTHCGVHSATVDGRLWLADPPLSDDSDNPPPGWDENWTGGYFLVTGPGRAEFRAHSGQTAQFRLAPRGSADPIANCE